MHVPTTDIVTQILKGDLCRGFTVLSQSWYARSCLSLPVIDEITIGIYGNKYDEGTCGEFSVEWQTLSGKVAAKLKVFDDAWEVLPLFQDLIRALPELEDFPPEDFAKRLIEMGYIDLTKRTQDVIYPRAPDYSQMKVKALRPQRVDPVFADVMASRPPIVVMFMGGASFCDGVVRSHLEIAEWVKANCKPGYHIDPNDIFFHDEADALLCHMRFA